MNPDLKTIVENAKEWQLEFVTVSRCLCVGPCLFQYINPKPTATNAALIINVYDGQGDQGDLKVCIHHKQTYPCCCLPNPAYFRRGLYVDLNTNAAGATVQYLPLKD